MWEYNHTDELYHHGVKGMKWGVRKARQAEADLRSKKSAYKKAKKAYDESYNKAYNKAIAAYSPIKKHRENNDKRWEDAANKSEAMKKAKSDYKSAKKEFNKNTTVGQKAGAAIRSDGAKKAAKTLASIGALLVYDQVLTGGTTRKVYAGMIKATGRIAVTAYMKSRGATDIRWYD
jgi:prenyltransferase beta subunit